MSLIKGTHLEVKFSRVVDGDTIRVFLPGADRDESVRILALDTEESFGGGSKPVTPWGRRAKERAEAFFRDAQQVTIEFPGQEDVDVALQRYRGNFGRALVFVYREGVDFQETMIREGYSPYFMKYGHAAFAGHQARYELAELEAQRSKRGVWDQIEVNGSEMRNYAALGTWWLLRASIVDSFRALRAVDDSILNTRLDNQALRQLAATGAKGTVFTEMRSISRVGANSGQIGIGSIQHPFSLFVPDIDSDSGREIVNLLETRYASGGETHPRRSYAYVTGELSLFQDRPQIVLHSADQISDGIMTREETDPVARLKISALLPNPIGPDPGFERVRIHNSGGSSVNLQGWHLRDRSGSQVELSGTIEVAQQFESILPAGQMQLNNAGDEVVLLDPNGRIHNAVAYSSQDVIAGQVIEFASN